METIGKGMSPDEIADAVCRDSVFYDSSGGGVTISGGEPTMQPQFLLATLSAVKGYGIHTAVETCGCFDEKLIKDLLETADLFLYDIKHTDPVIHREYTGVSGERTLANFSTILSQAGSARIIPRIPLIPGFNDDGDSIGHIISYLRVVGYAGPVHLMPYNRMAKTKWGNIGRASAYRDMGVQTRKIWRESSPDSRRDPSRRSAIDRTKKSGADPAGSAPLREDPTVELLPDRETRQYHRRCGAYSHLYRSQRPRP